MGCLTDVAGYQHAATPRSFDVARRLFGVCVFLLVEVADEDIRALSRICDSYGPPLVDGKHLTPVLCGSSSSNH